MRIRSTKPEFWRSRTVASVDWESRFVLKGLESYVDDNGVGKDDIELIVGDLFPRDMLREPSRTLARVSEAISHLHQAGLVWRYEVDGKNFLYVSNWENIQRVDKPQKGRYPRPDGTSDYRESIIRESSTTPREGSRTLAPGTGEQGNRGTDLSAHPQDAQPEPDRFPEFWMAYPKKVSKKRAEERWKTAIKKTDPQVIIDGLARYVAFLNLPDQWQQPKDPDGWLSQERWNDQLDGIQADGTTTDGERKPRPGEMGYITPEMPDHIRAQFDNPPGGAR